MKCWICEDQTWHSLKELNAERELAVCKNCGAVAYQVEPESEEKVKEFYRKAYRPEPTYENLLTTTRKQNYIAIFLRDFLKGKKDLICGDVGCATGYIPHWLRTLGHKSTGSELTLAYRRFAEHFYGIPIPEDLEPKHRYDLISLYHVLEHLTEPDKKLAHYVSLLKDDGHMFIATPEWLDVLEEASGTPTSTFQHLFHKEHINVFTSQSIKNLFAKAGLIIEKEDHIQYGQTYLLRKDPHRETCIVKEDWQEIVDKIHRQNTAIKLYNEKKYQEAIDVWPKFPEAWLQLIFQRHGKEPEYQNELFEKAHEVIGDNCRLAQPRGIWLWQQERYQTAYEQLSWCASVRPNDDVFWFMGQCLIQLGQPKTAMAAFQRCHEMNPERWKECIAAICQLAARMPAWDERALAAMKEELAKGFKPEFKDVALEEKTATAT